MQDRVAGVKLEDVTLRTSQIKKCFSGNPSTVCDWLYHHHMAGGGAEVASCVELGIQ